MKLMVNALRFVLIAALPLLASCSKSSYNNQNPPATSDFKANLAQGTWMITSYTQKTEDKTSQFAGATFTFSTSGTLTASQNGSVTTGSWAFTPSSVGYYGGPPSNASMTISLGNQSPFGRLSRTWNVDSTSAPTLSLVNPEPNDDEHVKFSRQ
jgi:hypothetical protein